jgi:hypothetical protein
VTTPSGEELQAAVRAHLRKVARRYVPAMSFLAALLLIVIVAPTKVPSAVGVAGLAATDAASGTTGVAGAAPADAPAGSVTDTPATPGSTGTVTGSSSTTAGGPAMPGSSGISRPGAPIARRSGSAPTKATRSGGGAAVSVARSGVRCTGTNRQVPWSSYAPLCVTAFKGNNGGATAPGVTATTITLSFRIADSGQSAAIGAASGGGDAGKAQTDYLADLQPFIDHFNTTFELYGRKVVVKTFHGQGDWVAEYGGQGQAQAQADAVTARDLGAFADISTATISSTPTYDKELAQQKVISVGGAAISRAIEQQYAPYIYSVQPASEDLGNFQASLICQRMVGLKATFAGDALTQTQTRVFGIVNAENPEVSIAADQIESHINGCGGKVARRVQYAIDLPTLASTATNAIAQMKAAGVTTLLCLCDTITPTLLTTNADSQQYHPEWSNFYHAGDNFGQQRSQDQWKHSITSDGDSFDVLKSEAYKVYKVAKPTGEPVNVQGNVAVAYKVAVMLFSQLQAAGPDLTPASLARGTFGLPDSLPSALAPGGLGPWHFGPGRYTPYSATRVGYWSPTTTSTGNGAAGTTLLCKGDDAAWRPTTTFDPAAYGPAHTQLKGCFDA